MSDLPKGTPITLQYYIVTLVIQPMFSVHLYEVNECVIIMPYSGHLEFDLIKVHGVCISILHCVYFYLILDI